ncbi:MAG TPA: M43 family zinc metalloprotease [Vicingaceae bacterium]|nr:M43 family zinc metalloprotease [Vicingaceae bacterium]
MIDEHSITKNIFLLISLFLLIINYNTMKFKLLLFFLFFGLLKANSQTIPCRASEENAKVYQNNPSALQEKMDFDAFSREFAKKKKSQNLKQSDEAFSGETYIIPVVFHVYGEIQSGKTVTYEKIVTHLEHLNDDFNGRNEDFATVEPYFQDIRGTIDVAFKLAKIDPNGGCTNGVVFYPAKNGYGNGGGYDAQIAADAWDNEKYMNVYIQNDLYNDGTLNNSGVAWYPSTYMTDANTARVVFNGAYLYDNSFNKEFSATLTHEFGHFLNLIHTFEGGCSGTDEVSDTPKEDAQHALSCTPGTNCDGDKVNIENYMGYNGAQGCYKMYTQGQITRMEAAMQHPARITLWQPQNLIDTGVNTTGGTLVASATSFKEAVVNDGSFDTSSIISLDGGEQFAMATGTMTQGTHFTHTFPAGLTPILTVSSSNELSVTITGTATNHALANNTSGDIAFLPAAFSGGTANLACTSLYFNFKYADPYGIFFVDMPDVVISSAADWEYFEIAIGDDPAFGGWRFGPNALKIETFSKKLVCETGTRNISFLAPNVGVDASSNLTSPGSYPNQLDLRTADYTSWDGVTGYVGFDYLIDGATCYGWFKVSVDANGDGYTISEYAYNTEPGSVIYTGMTDSVSVVLSPNTLYEADTNDGAVTSTSTISLSTNNGTFTRDSGTFTAGTDYTITGVPAGLTAILTLQNDSEVEVSFAGHATSHLPANDAAVVITFRDAAITGGITVLDNAEKTIHLKFEAPYGVFYVNNPDYTVSQASNWQWFDLAIGDDTEYGAWVFDATNLKIETYGKRLVTETGTRNISLIPIATTIDASSNFVAPGAYPNQLDLRTSSYTTWDDQTAYVGFEYTSRGRICYGWLHVKVEAGGVGYTVLDFAYNTKPNELIITGTDQSGSSVLAPSYLQAVGDLQNLEAQLTWENNALSATSVIVERAGADNVFAEIAVLASTETTYTDTGLTQEIIYQYRVRALEVTEYSAYSNVASVLLTNNPVPTLDAPQLYGTAYPDQGFYVQWALVTGATQYEVQLKDAAGDWVTYDTVDNPGYYLWIPKQGSQNIYEVRVRAKNTSEISDWSYAIIDLEDGVFTLSTINHTLEIKSFLMYPNPASDVVKFNFNNLDVSNMTLTIYQINGAVIDVVKGVSRYSVSHLAKGVYIVMATDGNFVATKKLIVK